MSTIWEFELLRTSLKLLGFFGNYRSEGTLVGVSSTKPLLAPNNFDDVNLYFCRSYSYTLRIIPEMMFN